MNIRYPSFITSDFENWTDQIDMYGDSKMYLRKR